MMVQQVPGPLYGAAYQVLYERLNPAACKSLERRKEIEIEVDAIREWARAQSDIETVKAYFWAAALMLHNLDEQFKHDALGLAVGHAFKTIARPPS